MGIIQKHFRFSQPIRIKYSIGVCSESIYNKRFAQWPLTSALVLLLRAVLVWLWGQIWHILLIGGNGAYAWNSCVAQRWKLCTASLLIRHKVWAVQTPFCFQSQHLLFLYKSHCLCLDRRLCFTQCQMLFQTTLVSFLEVMFFLCFPWGYTLFKTFIMILNDVCENR